jgi:hypothetical protein
VTIGVSVRVAERLLLPTDITAAPAGNDVYIAASTGLRSVTPAGVSTPLDIGSARPYVLRSNASGVWWAAADQRLGRHLNGVTTEWALPRGFATPIDFVLAYPGFAGGDRRTRRDRTRRPSGAEGREGRPRQDRPRRQDSQDHLQAQRLQGHLQGGWELELGRLGRLGAEHPAAAKGCACSSIARTRSTRPATAARGAPAPPSACVLCASSRQAGTPSS